MNGQNVILQVRDLKKYYEVNRGLFSHKLKGTVKAVDGLSFDIYQGETLGVIGESGCGKSTLARLLLGLTDATGGSASFMGKEIHTRMPREMRRDIQMVFQDPYSSMDPRMNVRKIVEEPLRIHRPDLSTAEKDRMCLELLEELGFSRDDMHKYPHEFSGGQRQRLGIARAFILKPQFVICDEPVSALDVSIQAQILNLFKSIQKQSGVTYMFISHDMGVVKHMSTRIAVMYLGHILELADKHTLFAHARHPYTHALMDAIPVPDPDFKKSRGLLQGELPSPINPPAGCPFAPRCEKADGLCTQCKPLLRQIQPGHWVACHKQEESGVSGC